VDTKLNYNEDELQEEIISIRRVTKVLKGGRKFSFRALVAVGDGKGVVGVGLGKAREVPDAIRKAIQDAKKNLFRVPLRNGTIPHTIETKFKAGRIIMKPAAPGTGLIAGISARPILNRAGITDILAKNLGSRTPVTVAYTVVKALKELRSPEEVRELRKSK